MSRRSSAARAARRFTALGFLLNDGHRDADQPVELVGRGARQQPFGPGALALAERREQAAQERQQRDALELHAPHGLTGLLLPLCQTLVAVRVAQGLRRDRGDHLHESHILVGERGPSRKVRRKIAPIATPLQVIGTTVMDFTRRLMSSLFTCFRLGSVAASG